MMTVSASLSGSSKISFQRGLSQRMNATRNPCCLFFFKQELTRTTKALEWANNKLKKWSTAFAVHNCKWFYTLYLEHRINYMMMITLITFNPPCDAGRNITETSGFTYKSAYSHDLMELLMAVTSTALRSTDAQTNTLTETINSLYLSH